MTQWYLDFDNGEKYGPIGINDVLAHTSKNKEGYAWREGFADWKEIADVPELNATVQNSVAPIGIKDVPSAVGTQQATPTTPTAAGVAQGAVAGVATSMGGASGSSSYTPKNADEIDFKIYGNEMQYVEIELDPEESAISEAGSMMYKSPRIVMDTIFGDGSDQDAGGMFKKMLGAGKRLVTGESLFTTVFTNEGYGKERVAFASPFPGKIVPVDLSQIGGTLICQKDSFLCAAQGVSIGIHFQKKILTGLFGGEGFIMQKLEGDGLVFVHAGGMLKEVNLNHDDVLHIDTGCIVAMQKDVKFEIERVGGIKTSLFGGEGFFFARVQGPGKIWLQSLPFSRLAGRMLTATPGPGNMHSQGEGSALGFLGSFVMGDND